MRSVPGLSSNRLSLLMSFNPKRAFPIAVLAIAVAVAGIAIATTATHANGRVAKFIRQSAGPYEVALGIIPSSPAVGALHLTITITELASEASVLDANVVVTGEGPDAGSAEIGPVVAKNNPTDPAFYEVSTTVDRVGVWTFTVSVDGEAGAASTEFALSVKRPSPFFRIFTWVTVLVFVAAVSLGLLPFIRERARGRRAKRRRR